MQKKHKYFPIKQGIACQSKWAWSTLYLTEGVTKSCHRASTSVLTEKDFNKFHNTDVKIYDRLKMLKGVWPTGGCEYCKNNEESGGFSDRMLQNSIPDLSPVELETDINAIVTTPTILEVFFDNTCNLSCLYCVPFASSKISEENKRFGDKSHIAPEFGIMVQKQSKPLIPLFWKWMDENFHTLKRFHFLGGEPFLIKEVDTLIDFIDSHPNPDCELNFISNLMIPFERLEKYILKIKDLVDNKRIKRFDLTASIDCWGPEQEFVRYGLDLNIWKRNFEYLLGNDWITLNINQTISVLTIKTMPELLLLLKEWREVRMVGHYFSVVEPGPTFMRPSIFGGKIFDKDFELILSLMDQNNENDMNAYKYMESIAKQTESKEKDVDELKMLLAFLNEKSTRYNKDWKVIFPWLDKELENLHK